MVRQLRRNCLCAVDYVVLMECSVFQVPKQCQIADNQPVNDTLQTVLVLGIEGRVPNSGGASQDGLNNGRVEVHLYRL